ncbi:MAG: hypothetical protein J6L65_04025 [Lachnospiraceae bacterium]|nr:hypothetical protein [Lachnospiraceae bacterium]
MSNQGMRKECNFCGAKFGQGVKLCPNCGSANVKLVAQASAEFLEAVSEESEKAKQSGAENKKPKKNRKKVIVILVSVLVGIFVLLIVASQLVLWWADRAVEKDKLSISEQVERVLDDTKMSDEEWKEAMLPLLDELYLWQMNEKLVEVFNESANDNRPIYEWEHYPYLSDLVNFSIVEGIWEYEQSYGSLKDYHNTQLLYYCLEYIGFEEDEELTAEEKEKLQRYVINLRQDVTTRFNLTEEELEELYRKACEEYGYVDYSTVERLLKERAGIQAIEDVDEAIKHAQTLHGSDWEQEIFVILDYLYEKRDYKRIYEIYEWTQVQDSTKSITKWTHYVFVRTLYDIYDIEKVLEAEASGLPVREWQYVNILIDYFEFEDFENRINLSDEETIKLAPLVVKLREDAAMRWNLTESELAKLRKKVVSEFNVVIYEEAEKFVEAWMEEMGYANDGDTITEELINSNGMDDDIWEKKFYPKFDKLYENGTDTALYEISRLLIGYDRSLERWQHNDYVEMLECYYDTERVWGYEGSDRELDKSDYTRLLYDYLVFEHWDTNQSLSSDEMEKLKPYREKILQDGAGRWDFSKEEWEQINDTINTRGGYVYYFDASDFIDQWLAKQ